MTNTFKNLLALGLTQNQATVYLALFRMQGAKAGEIIKKTGMHRNIVYTCLEELVDAKLVSASKVKGLLHYKPLAPSQLLVKVNEQERIAKELVHDLSREHTKNVQEITVYEGVDELREHERRTYLNAPNGSTLYYLGVSPEWYEIMGTSLVEELAEIQKKKKLVLKHITNAMTASDSAYKRKTGVLSLFKELPLVASNTSCTVVMHDRIAIRSYLGPYFVVEIAQKQLAENYRNYFEALWKSAS